MRERSTTLFLALVCILGIDGAPTPAPDNQKHMDQSANIMRLPEHQTACIVDVIQNNTDPETHIVSKDVEVLLTKCFFFPAPFCSEDNPECSPPNSDNNHREHMQATMSKERPMQTTDESSRAAEVTTESSTPGVDAVQVLDDSSAPAQRPPSRRVKKHLRPATSPASTDESSEAKGISLGDEGAVPSTETNPKAESSPIQSSDRQDESADAQDGEPQPTTPISARADDSDSIANRPEHADTLTPQKQKSTTPEPARADDAVSSTETFARADETGDSQEGEAQPTTPISARADDSDSIANRPEHADTLTPQKQKSTTPAPARADDSVSSTEISARADTSTPQLEKQTSTIATPSRADDSSLAAEPQQQSSTPTPGRADVTGSTPEPPAQTSSATS